jgi:hypothetical protein
VRDPDELRGEWLDAWVRRTGVLALTFTEQFESGFGYPPGDHLVEPASAAGREVSANTAGLPEDLLIFYRHVAEVSLPDLGSGYFLHPVDLTAAGMSGDLPTRITGSRADSVVVFGSDGGGALFALSTTDGSTVYRLPPSGVEGDVYTEGAIPCEVVGVGLASFLAFLERELQDGAAP